MKKCENCDGIGGWEVGVPCSPDVLMWVDDDGECMQLGFKECFWCGGKGEISEEREAEMKKLKKKR